MDLYAKLSRAHLLVVDGFELLDVHALELIL